MLEDLRIKDFALIDSAYVEFSSGFTVLSGETGAGKSLLIGALTFLLGGKAGSEQIRQGANEAVVSGTFYIKDLYKNLSEIKSECESRSNEEDEPDSDFEEDEIENATQWLFCHGISCEDDRILLRRQIRASGKSSAWIGSTPVTRADLASFSSFLIDIHGQHEHQSLMKIATHRKFLDSYAGINEKVKDFTSLYLRLIEKRKKLADFNADEKNRENEIELLSFAVKEIADSKLKSGEDVDLEDEETKLSSFEKLYADLESVNFALSGSEGHNNSVSADSSISILAALKKILASASHATLLDKNLESLSSRLENIFYELNDISDEFKTYLNSLVFDPERLAFVQERLNLIYNLKKKYSSSVSSSIDEILDFAKNAEKKLEILTVGKENKEELEKEISALEKKVYAFACEISSERKSCAKKMSSEVEHVLSELGMKGTVFSVGVSEKSGNASEQKCGPYGIDDVEFLISANPGNPLQSMAKIASGGELSRIMLALKTILSKSDEVPTLIFDEIDTGIGGEIAVSVGRHLKNLAKNKQVLCITHLASIAVYADNQIKIEKSSSDGKSRTDVKSITENERVQEIARMLSGDCFSSESLKHAKSMLLKFGKKEITNGKNIN